MNCTNTSLYPISSNRQPVADTLGQVFRDDGWPFQFELDSTDDLEGLFLKISFNL